MMNEKEWNEKRKKYFDAAKEKLWISARARTSTSGVKGKTPREMNYKQGELRELNVASRLGKEFIVKAFYENSKHCFYLDIDDENFKDWFLALKAVKETKLENNSLFGLNEKEKLLINQEPTTVEDAKECENKDNGWD
jgi:ABC-type antimicrobial peptide transport system ATPase subunit